ncbi:amidohydrolase family protein [Bosea psychrotolerans]|uniref:Putative TIM-barrel fold metal-dependent hydrolase n=1 Tax=Bosea psychrotolerans TaxID=1871628 RepID=A0A2S4M6I6_9HYPH|nr:amidohydrolase family protein [Bosea psychrotolerans]POR50324.1 putative TIM-barrel fold metal-dependent hydrolase [Bosea psychrotolerans]
MADDGPVPNSAGMAAPRSAVPAGACDAHCHILDPRFPSPDAEKPSGMTFDDYRLLQVRLGTQRAVVVQSKFHRQDHACLLDALRRFDGTGRGIGVLDPGVSDAELKRLDAGGVRGLRFSVWNPADTVTTIAMIEPLARRIADLGWHAQLHMMGDQIVAHAALLKRLPCAIVFDHMGRLPPSLGPQHAAFAVIGDLLAAGRAWVKLAGAYLNTQIGAPDYPDAGAIARAFVGLAPERLVWGSDWPHVTEPAGHKPDDAVLLDLLDGWSGAEAVRRRILVDNPAELYGFG